MFALNALVDMLVIDPAITVAANLMSGSIQGLHRFGIVFHRHTDGKNGAANETVTLATGTKQSIPTGGNRLLKAVRNMSAASNGTGKRSVRLVDREVLDAQSPDWHDPTVAGDAAHTTIVKHYVYDEANPRNFYVYPGVAGNAYLEIIYSSNPATVAQNGSLSIPDIYANAIMNYVLYMAYMKDAEYAGNAQRASSHFQLFTTSVTGKGQIDAMTNPNMERRQAAV